MDVTSKYLPNKALEAKKCYGTTSIEHPAVSMITTERGMYVCMYVCIYVNMYTCMYLPTR